MKKGIFVFFFILVCDFAIKRWAFTHLVGMGGIPLIQNFLGCSFSLSFVANKGMAWGLFASHSSLLLVFRIVLISSLIFYLFSKAPQKSQFPILMILAGAIGNIVDSFLYGFVVDMFYPTIFGFAPFAVFNLADFAISMGVFWLAIQMFFERKKDASLAHRQS
ncbi:MAG: signal peptidase II [Candidatus Algichlamydia australiensis]|nr:signal peptidase II [Chlamydiales bacterium]